VSSAPNRRTTRALVTMRANTSGLAAIASRNVPTPRRRHPQAAGVETAARLDVEVEAAAAAVALLADAVAGVTV